VGAGFAAAPSSVGFNGAMVLLWVRGLGIAVLLVVLVFSLRALLRQNAQTPAERERFKKDHPVSGADTPPREDG
jgi:hypothetical protein